MLREFIASLRNLFRLSRSQEKQLLLGGAQLSYRNRGLGKIDSLADAEFRVFSQWGEDGIIDWLVSLLPDIPQTFIEFGVEDYRESNTRFLLQHKYWRGLVLDSGNKNIRTIKESELYWRHDLTAVEAFITKDNINTLITSNGFSGEVGILSIDLDGNDYWIFDAINCVNPAVIVCEINGVFGDKHAITIPYREDFSRLGAHSSGQYFGASLNAMRSLAESKGYTFIGTTKSGVNAFFIRNDLSSAITPAINAILAYPNQHRDSRDSSGKLNHLAGELRAQQISSLNVYSLEEDKELPLGSLGGLYSANWQAGRPS